MTETERHAKTLSRKLYLMKFLTLTKFWARGGGFPAIFFVSGLSGLIYESIWTHYLKLFLGHAAYAQTLVLVIFMGGLAIGAALVGKLALAISHPIRVYALVEGTIGVFGLVFHQLFLGSTEAFWSITPNLASFPWLLQISRWALATALILPQAVLLGATFPLLAAGVMRRSSGDSGGVIATLYFSNSLGGALGVLLSGFVLVPFCGMPNTVAIAGLLNLVVASVAWSLQHDEPEPLLTAAFARTTAQSSESLSIRFVVMVAFATGASSFVYEVGWIRMLSLVMGSATYSFELMLCAFILGLALGGAFLRRRIERLVNLRWWLGGVQLAMGLAALATLPLYNLSFDFMAWLMSVSPKSGVGYAVFNLGRYGIAMAVMLPASFFAGMTLPLLTRMALKGRGEKGVGEVYAANTLGAIVGVVLAVHVGLPYVGLEWMVASGALIDVAIGIGLMWAISNRSALFATVASVFLMALPLSSFDLKKMASGVFRYGEFLDGPTKVLRVEHGKTATVALTDALDGSLAIRTNGKADAAMILPRRGRYEPDEVTMVMLGAVPLMLIPEPRRAAVIGFGAGISTHALLADQRLQQVDTVEIEPAMIEVAKAFRPYNLRAYEDVRSHLHIDDAKSFFAAHRTLYDLILSEPSNPWVSGVSGLFSREFYRKVRAQLAPKGLLAQWIQLYELDPDRLLSILKAIDAEFTDYVLIALHHGDVLVLASPDRNINISDLEFQRVGPELLGQLAYVDIRRSEDVISRVVANKQVLAPLLKDSVAPPNSDFYPYLDRWADADRFLDRSSREITAFTQALLPFSELTNIRRVLPGPVAYTPSGHFGRSTVGLIATLVRDRVLISPDLQAAPSGPLAQAARNILERCERAPDIDAALEFSKRVIPFISPDEGRQVLLALVSKPCMAVLAGTRWKALLSALADRNLTELSKITESLLNEGEASSVSQGQYVLALAMSAQIGLGNREQAKSLWQRWSGDFASPLPAGFLFRVLKAYGSV